MHIFSQYLNKTEQAEFLEKADKFFVNLSKKENLTIVFVYPVSGQMMGPWKEGEKWCYLSSAVAILAEINA